MRVRDLEPGEAEVRDRMEALPMKDFSFCFNSPLTIVKQNRAEMWTTKRQKEQRGGRA
jgi:hypothetical protein